MAPGVRYELYDARQVAAIQNNLEVITEYHTSAQPGVPFDVDAYIAALNLPIKPHLASQQSSQEAAVEDSQSMHADLANRRTTSFLSPHAPAFIPTYSSKRTFQPVFNEAHDQRLEKAGKPAPSAQQFDQAYRQGDGAASQTESMARVDSFEYVRLSHLSAQEKVTGTIVTSEGANRPQTIGLVGQSSFIPPQQQSDPSTTGHYTTASMMAQRSSFLETGMPGAYGDQSFNPPSSYGLPSTLRYSFTYMNRDSSQTGSNGGTQQLEQPLDQPIFQPEPRVPRLSLQMARVLEDHVAEIALEENLKNRELELDRLVCGG